MTTSGPSGPAPDKAANRADGRPARAQWGAIDVVVAFVITYATALVGQVIYLQVKGIAAEDFDPDTIALSEAVILQIPLWSGFLLLPIAITFWRGNGPVRDLGLRTRFTDAPFGVMIGVVCQLVLVPLVSAPVLWLSDSGRDDLEESARALSDRATGTGGVLLFVFMVVVMAPIAEEVFYRGLLHRALVRALPVWPAMVLTALLFGAVHLEPLLIPALSAFGLVLSYLVYRTDRIGMAVWAHVGFNATTVLVLLVGID